MSKNKKSIELENISFTQGRDSYTLLRFFPIKMSVDVMAYEDGIKVGIRNIPFAHLPKEIKKIIKPN